MSQYVGAISGRSADRRARGERRTPHQGAANEFRRGRVRTRYETPRRSESRPKALFGYRRTGCRKTLRRIETKNKPAQLRRFYDEFVLLHDKVVREQAKFEEQQPFIQMLKAKVAYAAGRDKVDDNFRSLLCRVVDQTVDVETLRQARLFMEAFMAFYKVYQPRAEAKPMELQLHKIQKLHGELELLSGLRIGASEGEIRIGGVDHQVIRHPYTDEPYIPGSSIKGKVRSLLEWLSGAVQQEPLSYKEIEQAQLVRPILQLFGVGGGDQLKTRASRRVGTDAARFLGCAVHRPLAQRDRARQSSMGRGQNRKPHRPHPRSRRAPAPERAGAGRRDLRLHGIDQGPQYRCR